MSDKPPTPLDRAALDDHPLPKIEAGDKDSHGRILIIAGSRSVPGAALLAAHGAMRAGAGKLQIATTASVAPHLAIAMPEAMVLGFAEDDDGGSPMRPSGRCSRPPPRPTRSSPAPA